MQTEKRTETCAVPRVVIAGTNSGCGKTTLVCALLKALKNRGLCAGAFKCGPDYIDPMFHSRIIGTACSNLDSFFFDPETLRYLLARNGAGRDINILEGVMGYYDGRGYDGFEGSTFEIAQLTKSPVILVVNARGAALSVLAQIYGFLQFHKEVSLESTNPAAGVIFNQCTAGTCQMLNEAVQKRFGERLRVFGYLPVMKESSLESRHLGLVTAQEVEDLQEKIELTAQQAERSIDLDGILKLAGQAEPVCCRPPEKVKALLGAFRGAEPVRIAVARDRAFCFYYEDSLQLLKDLGAELVAFSPLEDEALPREIDGLYLGGGYPELYAGQLSRNRSMLESIRNAVAAKLPCIAECGGFMYLTEAIGEWPMVGSLRGSCHNTGRLSRFGYVTLTAECDTMICGKGEQIPAHEFHYWDADLPGEDLRARKPSGRTWQCVHASPQLYAGFPHFHFYSAPRAAGRFYRACLDHAGAAREIRRKGQSYDRAYQTEGY